MITKLTVWPELAPGEVDANPGHLLTKRGGNVSPLTNVTSPELFVYPTKTTRPTVLVLPGGGYEILAIDLEGTEVAEWLHSLGYAVAILHYRVPNKRNDALADGQRALAVLRNRSAEFGLDPDHLGILGFSAGGHLAIRLAVNGDDRRYNPVDALDGSFRGPDFVLGIYPAYLIDRATSEPSEDVVPHAGMPPIYLTQTRDDDHFCVEQYDFALKQAGVDVRTVIYDRGGHGYGVRPLTAGSTPPWQADAAKWLEEKFPC